MEQPYTSHCIVCDSPTHIIPMATTDTCEACIDDE